MAKYIGYKKPRNTKRTLLRLISYMGRHKFSMFVVGILVIVSSLASVFGTYMLKPIINQYIIPKDIPGLVKALLFMGILYAVGASATLGYNRLMVKTSQKIVKEIRKDLFNHTQTLPLAYFDAHTHEPFYQRCGYDCRGAEQQLHTADPELYHDGRHHGDDRDLKLPAVAYRAGLYGAHVPVYPVQWET